MTITTDLATLRALFRQQLRRLGARPIEGGPMDAVRDGVLIAFHNYDDLEVEVDSATISALAALPDGVGPAVVLSALALEDTE